MGRRKSNCKDGNAKKSSRFICLRCLKQNFVGAGIQRPNTKEKDHIKNIGCLCIKMRYKTKNLEVRWCDDFKERMEYAEKIRHEFYDDYGNYIGKYDEDCIDRDNREVIIVV